MVDYYTVKQIQELLKVDRITIYRMLQDGRLKGIKIGHQWRFSQDEISRLLGVVSINSTPGVENPVIIPTHCIQTIQNLYSNISQMTSLVVDMQGNPLTEISNPCRFCSAINSSTPGGTACRATWREVALSCTNREHITTCHSGLNYATAPIYDQGTQIGAFITGQFYLQTPDRYEETERVHRLASLYKISNEILQDAVLAVPVVATEHRKIIESWPRVAAQAIQSILEERTGFISRLQKIANLTQLS